MIYWKCLNCETNNLYPNNIECECCGESISADQIEEASRFSFYKQRADEGDTYAMIDLARFYAEGSVFKQDIESALLFMEKSAKLGNAEAQQELAEWYFCDDNDFPNDEASAFQWASLAYSNKNPYSIYFLHRCYLFGFGTEVNIPKSMTLLEEAANMGFSAALADIANYYYTGKYLKKNDEKAASFYEQLSTEDNCSLETAYNAGLFCWQGIGGASINYKQAIKWFEYAVSRFNDWGSKVPLAKFYYDGTGFPKNKVLAKKMMIEVLNNHEDMWAAEQASKYLDIWKNED